ncbi:MAG: hypothetical protein ACXU9K_11900 [Thermodesulfobacteriota bacterium]
MEVSEIHPLVPVGLLVLLLRADEVLQAVLLVVVTLEALMAVGVPGDLMEEVKEEVSGEATEEDTDRLKE